MLWSVSQANEGARQPLGVTGDGTTMPTFIDRHLLTAVSPAIQRRLHSEVALGVIDPSGLKPLAHWIEDRLLYCVLMAPDHEAVCEHHKARGLDCDDVHPMTELQEVRPTSREDQAVVRGTIDAVWHSQTSLDGHRGTLSRRDAMLTAAAYEVNRI